MCDCDDDATGRVGSLVASYAVVPRKCFTRPTYR